MGRLCADIYPKNERKTKILQFGLNNFLKGTADLIVSSMNESGAFNSGIAVVLTNPTQDISSLQAQDGMYTAFLQGLLDGEGFEDNQVVDVFDEFINPYTEYSRFLKYAESDTLEFVFANTADEESLFDENDISFAKTPLTFIGKLLSFLKARFDYYLGDITKGLHIIPVEEGEGNGEEIKEKLIKLAKAKKLSFDFINWINYSNTYALTYVDRLVEKCDDSNVLEELEYDDEEAIKTEHFYTWIIQGTLGLDKVFPTEKAGVDVEFVDDIKPYLDRATKMICGSYIALSATGVDTANGAFAEIKDFVKDYIVKEAAPTIDLLDIELEFFSDSLFERYENPFIDEKLEGVSMDCVKEAILPVILQSEGIAKRALLIFASYVVANGIDLGSDPDYLQIDNIIGASEYLTNVIDDIANLGYVGAIKKNF